MKLSQVYSIFKNNYFLLFYYYYYIIILLLKLLKNHYFNLFKLLPVIYYKLVFLLDQI